MAKMESHELAAKILREESAPILEALMRTMADPTAKAREKLKAVREFKQCLHSLKRVVEARQTAPALRRDLIEVLRAYRNGVASAYCSPSSQAHQMPEKMLDALSSEGGHAAR